MGQQRQLIQETIQHDQAHLNDLKQQLASRQQALDTRMRGTYKSNGVSYLSVVMGAHSFNDFLNRVSAMNTIAESDRQLISSVFNAKKAVEDDLSDLSSKQHQFDSLLQSLNADQQQLVAARAQQQSVVDSIKSQKQENDSQLAQLQAQAAGIDAKMSEIQSQSQGSSQAGSNGGGSSHGGGSTITVVATAYCLAGDTATGMATGRGIIAVDPSVIPLGSRVYVSGYGAAIAADTGGAIIGNRIDVWLPCGEAEDWGSRTVTVTIQ